MFSSKRVAAALAFWSLFVSFGALGAGVGDVGQPLAIAHWVKGDAVEVGAGEKVIVVEFWATWCPPCRDSIPHLSALQEKYKDDLVIVGVSDEDTATVTPFVEQMGDTMDYTIAIDDNAVTTGRYMGAYGQSGIPTAFVLDRQGRVTWIGNPLLPEFETTVEKVVAGAYDGAMAREDYKLMKAREALFNEFQALCMNGDTAAADTLADRILREHMTEKSSDLLGGVAWIYLYSKNTEARNPKRAVEFAAAAAKATGGKNVGVLELYALTLSESGDLAGAVREQQRALEAAPEQIRPMVQKQLDAYLAAQSDLSAQAPDPAG